MSPVRDILQRFRPAGTPGKAAAAGIPADRARDVAAELLPVFASLAATQAESASIVSQAERDSQRIRADARARADHLVADARERVRAVRADAAAAVLAQAAADADAALGSAEREAQAIRARAAQRMPAYVSRAVQAVRGLTEDAADDGGKGHGAAGSDQTQAAARTGRAP